MVCTTATQIVSAAARPQQKATLINQSNRTELWGKYHHAHTTNSTLKQHVETAAVETGVRTLPID